MTLFLSLEWFSIALYVMCAIDYDLEGSLEAGLKYLDRRLVRRGHAALRLGARLRRDGDGSSFDGIASAIASQGLTGDAFVVVGIALMIAGLGFKMSAAPFHMWTPDVYEGAPTTVTAWMSSATKVAALLLTFRVMTTAFPDEPAPLGLGLRDHRDDLARDRQLRGARAEEREADPRLLRDRAGRASC